MAPRPGIPVLLLLLLLLLRGSGAQPHPASAANVFRQAAAALRGMLPEPVRETLLQYWQVAMDSAKVMVSGLAELCSDLLDALGIKGEELGTDRETLRRALSLGLAGLLLYLALSAALRLLGYLVGRLLWLVKLALLFLAAGYVVVTCEDEGRRNALLLGLGAAYLLLGHLSLPFGGGSGCCSSDRHVLESKVSALEHQLAEVEYRLHQSKLRDYD
ncbi:uncharacterized protein LOC132834559 [Hemiscyllium ocellatum]|uniref:uncharacterized protein LOC132834559 n=1 Tax=Hemiscyllium ocellatum TaxID=170820 RepID=UPI0029666245|nr:uncharacterized protein LOC132834559 [Hemiscyllium ocellatum]